MFKKVLSTALAFTMAMNIASAAMAAISGPIYGIEGNAYAYDKELGAVNLNEKNPAFTYGDTVYYPLTGNSGEEADNKITEAEKELTASTEALRKVKEELAALEASLKEKEETSVKASEKAVLAEKVLEKANEWKNSFDAALPDENEKNLSYIEALKAYDENELPATSASEAVISSQRLAEEAKIEAENSKLLADEAKASVEKKNAEIKTKEEDVKAKQEALNSALSLANKYIDSSEDVKGIKVKSQWDINGNAVESVSLTKKKSNAPFQLKNKYIYFLTVELKDSYKTGTTDISGTVSMKKTGEFDYEDMQLDVNLTVGFPEAENNVITKDPMIFSEGSGFSGDREEEFRFDFDDDAYFTVDTLGQKDILLAADNDFDANIAMIYNAANLNFFNGNGASFNKIGTLAIPAEEGSFLYKVDNDGRLTKSDAPYDKDEEAFMVRTRTLGRYVISDIDLKVGSSVKPSYPNSNGGTVNPQTGAEI